MFYSLSGQNISNIFLKVVSSFEGTQIILFIMIIFGFLMTLVPIQIKEGTGNPISTVIKET